MDWERALADVRPFLEPHVDTALLTPQTMERLLREKTANGQARER